MSWLRVPFPPPTEIAMLAGQKMVGLATQRQEQLRQLRDLIGFAIFQRYEYTEDRQAERLLLFACRGPSLR